MLRIALILVFLLAVFCEARHTHPRKDQWTEGEGEGVIALNDRDATEIEITNVAPKKLSRPNSILFFKSYDPCDDGFKLDYQGICREVWF